MRFPKILLTFLMLMPLQVFAVNVIEINTEWLWDSSDPHEGRVVGVDKKIKPPSLHEYNDELNYYASIIEQNDADIVVLIEIEGCYVADDVSRSLSGSWEVVCQKGIDTFTAQDVALIFDSLTFSVNQSSKTTL